MGMNKTLIVLAVMLIMGGLYNIPGEFHDYIQHLSVIMAAAGWAHWLISE